MKYRIVKTTMGRYRPERKIAYNTWKGWPRASSRFDCYGDFEFDSIEEAENFTKNPIDILFDHSQHSDVVVKEWDEKKTN